MADIIKDAQPAIVVEDHLVVSNDYQASDLERTRERPRRKAGKREFRTVEGFCAYVTRHKSADTCLYGHEDVLRAVLNDHGSEAPGHGDHNAVLNLRPHEDRIAWERAADGLIDQAALIDLIDEQIRTIADPPAADLAEMIATLRVARNTKIESARDLRSGNVRVTVSDEETGASNTAEIPGRIRLGLRLFEGRESPREIHVKLWWRLVEKSVRFRLKLLNLDEALEAERKAIDAEVTQKIELPVWR